MGLMAAHALTHIGIDFVLLESRSAAVVDEGSNMVIMPMAFRPLYQLGLEEAFTACTSILGPFMRIDHSGKNLGALYWSEFMEKL